MTLVDLPQLSADLFITDGGLETTLVFHDGLDLPDFAAFPLLDSADGRATIERYFGNLASVHFHCSRPGTDEP